MSLGCYPCFLRSQVPVVPLEEQLPVLLTTGIYLLCMCRLQGRCRREVSMHARPSCSCAVPEGACPGACLRRRCSGWTSGGRSWATSRAWPRACRTRGGPRSARLRGRCCRTRSSRCKPRRSGTLAGEGRPSCSSQHVAPEAFTDAPIGRCVSHACLASFGCIELLTNCRMHMCWAQLEFSG